MADTIRSDADELIAQARRLDASGDARGAVALLTDANRHKADATLECELVRLRREAGLRALASLAPVPERAPVSARPATGEVCEIAVAELTVERYTDALRTSGCLLVRGLVPPDRARDLAAGIDTALAACDAAASGEPVDPAWYSPGPMPDRDGGLPADANRRFLRERGGVWTADSPHMLFEWFETVDGTGIGDLMTAYLGERPLLSANKCTLRRVPPDWKVEAGWHQDGAFLGERAGAFNLWLALTRCGVDAPGLDIVPARIDHVIASDDASRFDWSISDPAIDALARDVPVARPEFEPGDALLFDHLLVHRTATEPDMTRPRHAIESWFFGPSAYPTGQNPLFF